MCQSFVPALRTGHSRGQRFRKSVHKPGRIPGGIIVDGQVDVSDVSLLIDVVLGKEVTLAEGAVPDLNSDGNVDITDVSKLIDLVLGIE